MAHRESIEREMSYQHYGWFKRRVLRRAETITTTNALLWGVAWLIISSILCWYFRLMPTSALCFTATGYVSLMWSVVLNLVACMCWAVLFLPLGLVRNPKLKSNELFSRLLFAHWPVAILLLPAIVGNRTAYTTFMNSPLTAFELYPMFSAVMTLVVLIVVVWWMMWSYQAISITTLKNKSVDKLFFAVIAVLGVVLSNVVTGYVLERAISLSI